MLHKHTSSTAFASVLALGLMIMPAFPASAQEKAAAPATRRPSRPWPRSAATVTPPSRETCAGIFDSVAYKTQSIQIKIDDSTEILRFDKASLQGGQRQGRERRKNRSGTSRKARRSASTTPRRTARSSRPWSWPSRPSKSRPKSWSAPRMSRSSWPRARKRASTR